MSFAVSPVLAFALVAAAPPPLAEDIPIGTDVAIRLEIATLAKDAISLWEELAALRKVVGRGPTLDVAAVWVKLHDDLATAGYALEAADFAPGTTLTGLWDLDVQGPPVWAVILRPAPKAKAQAKTQEAAKDKEAGADAKADARDTDVASKNADVATESIPAEALSVEGVEFRLRRDKDLAWASVDGVFVLGSERGVQRQLRRLLGRDKKSDEAIARQAQQLRKGAPVLAVVRPPDKQLSAWFKPLGELGTLLGKARGASLTGHKDSLVLRLEAGAAKVGDKGVEKDQKALQQGARAWSAALQERLSGFVEDAELRTGLETVGRPRPDKESLPTADRQKLLDVVRDSRLGATVRNRDKNAVEVELTYPAPRLLLVSLLLWGRDTQGVRTAAASKGGKKIDAGRGDPLTVQRSLLAMRELQRNYKRLRGQYVACGPVPRQIPKAPVAWPKGSCFDALGFRPGPMVALQWDAQLFDGRLALVARADLDGDGIPSVWFLGEEGVVHGPGITAAVVEAGNSPGAAADEDASDLEGLDEDGGGDDAEAGGGGGEAEETNDEGTDIHLEIPDAE